mmetsp:Transcript_5851/g.8303  ORF Transcript_5851/g.8303 Transcript_5851/m.8303 type:complete len:105 (-) Transcript_5851:269-583(-)|eukprot:CAMPEP_0194763354 /NCGR_PEP_ID=MMETSP0323_2-20130528/19080_1 /TAXON_ID=2866 ORGANISM="Crypthecodinium cohnii, Strain Seligo" /NCGR_SAMPLE_ID=MMETSP0323_2 /ASSEMBLY_ACC=CAM_ASM_000346 /LENGTH=104 /DNA_ID=CAMNT_0039687967 /DNA_START=85 /DNA_END=399 /DNA_ORIENTATION=+
MPEEKKVVIDSVVLQSMLTNVAFKTAFGCVAFIPALMMFRGAAMRCVFGGMGMGIGAGRAWAEADMHVRHPELVPMPESFQKEVEKYQTCVESKIAAFRAKLGI